MDILASVPILHKRCCYTINIGIARSANVVCVCFGVMLVCSGRTIWVCVQRSYFNFNNKIKTPGNSRWYTAHTHNKPVRDDALAVDITEVISWGQIWRGNYIDVIMGAMVSQITSFRIVHSTVHLGADQRKYQSSASLAFVRGNPR